MKNTKLSIFLENNRSDFLGFVFLLVPATTVYALALSMSQGNTFVSIICLLATYGISLLCYVKFEQWVMNESCVYFDSQVYEMVFLVTAICYSVTMLLLALMPGNPLFNVWNMIPWTITASLLNYASLLTNQKKYPRNENVDASRERLKSMFILVQMVVAGCVHAYAVLALIHAYIGGLFPIVEVVIGGFFFALGVLLAIKRATRPFPYGKGGLS